MCWPVLALSQMNSTPNTSENILSQYEVLFSHAQEIDIKKTHCFLILDNPSSDNLTSLNGQLLKFIFHTKKLSLQLYAQGIPSSSEQTEEQLDVFKAKYKLDECEIKHLMGWDIKVCRMEADLQKKVNVALGQLWHARVEHRVVTFCSSHIERINTTIRSQPPAHPPHAEGGSIKRDPATVYVEHVIADSADSLSNIARSVAAIREMNREDDYNYNLNLLCTWRKGAFNPRLIALKSCLQSINNETPTNPVIILCEGSLLDPSVQELLKNWVVLKRK